MAWGAHADRPRAGDPGSPPCPAPSCPPVPFRSLVLPVAEAPSVAAGDPPANVLSHMEAALLAAMRFPRRRRKWLLGRLAVKRLIAAELPALQGRGPSAISIQNDDAGAPYAEVEGLGTLPLCLSISHRVDFGAAAVAGPPVLALGLDLEMIEPRREDLFEDYFTENEMRTVRAAGSQVDLAVTRIWSAKEAVLKAAGVGLRLDTRLIDVGPSALTATGPDAWAPLAVDVSSEVGLKGELRAYWRWTEGDPYLLTAAVVLPESSS